MRKMKKILAVGLLTIVASLGATQVFAGAVETPGYTSSTSGSNGGAVETPGVTITIIIVVISALV